MLLEEGDTVDIDLTDVSLSFSPSGSYVYTSTLDHLEEGTFTVEGDLLVTTADTTADTQPQRVRILRLDSSRLHVQMKDQGKDRRLEFMRVIIEQPATDTTSGSYDEQAFEIDSLDMILDSAQLDDHDHDHDHDH